MTTDNLSGQVILEVLEEHDIPMTSAKLMSEIALLGECKPRDVKKDVSEALEAGLKYGFVKQIKRKYCTPTVYHAAMSQVKLGDLGDQMEEKPQANNESNEDSSSSSESEEDEPLYSTYKDSSDSVCSYCSHSGQKSGKVQFASKTSTKK